MTYNIGRDEIQKASVREGSHCDELLLARPACHAQIAFNTTSPPRSEIFIEHLRAGRLLAHERRPLANGTRYVDIKTHPGVSHIAAQLRVDGQQIDGVRFEIDCGRGIEPTLRNFIVIGAMKAGTTTLFELLAQHPALCQTWAHLHDVSFTKEINYFSRLYRKGNSPLHYDWRFPFDPAVHSWTLDVSPSYSKWPASKSVPARIASLGGGIKLAYILREPVDRIESHLAHRLRDRGKPTRLDHCVRTSRYAMQLDEFTAHIDRDDILLLDFEQLRRKPAAILAQICDFLGIDRFVRRSVVHNRRETPFRLSPGQRAELAETVRPDVQRLIDVYGFSPAERWLRRSPFYWFGLPGNRK